MDLNVKPLPGQTRFEVPEVEIAVHIPENQGVPFPGNTGDATHTTLQTKGKQLEVIFIYQSKTQPSKPVALKSMMRKLNFF